MNVIKENKMRQCKCRNCGTFINRDSAISVQNGKAKLWYCNENCRQQAEEKKVVAQKEQAEKDAVYNEICDIFNYKIVNTALWREWQDWNQVADSEKILAYLKENHDYIAGAIGRLSSSEYAKIRYLSAVLKNSLHDYKVKVMEEEKPIDKPIEHKINVDEGYETKYKPKTKRVGLEDIEAGA